VTLPPQPLPGSLAANATLSRWVNVAGDGTVTLRVGKVEIGQGILSALAQIAADELDVDLDRVSVLPANTSDAPDEGVTSGSMSIADSGSAVRQVCAEVRALFVAEAAAVLGLDPDAVTVSRGVIGDGGVIGGHDGRDGRSTSYGELAARVDLDRPAGGSAVPKASGSLRWVGTSAPRRDLPDKVAGRPRFIHDLVLPGQAYGRVVRPPSPAAALLDVDTSTAEAVPGVVAIVRDGRFLGVVADTEDAATRAASALAAGARWHEEATLPDEDDLPRFLRAGPVDTVVVAAASELPRAERAVRASYSRPFLAHASLAPSCGVARWDDSGVIVWSHTQGVYPLRRAIAASLSLDASRVTVHHVEGAGCYGHNGADDAAFDAVLLAHAVPGRPVHVVWSRRDELSWSPFGSAMAVDLEAGLDPSGRVVSWSCDVWSQGHVARPGSAGPGLLAAAHRERPVELAAAAEPAPERGGGLTRNAVPGYDIPALRVRGHRLVQPALRTSALRSLGAYANVFAIESFMDELALAAGRDPLEFRLAHLSDPRARDVLTAAADLAGWGGPTGDDRGLGIGFARYKTVGAYCAVVAAVEAAHDVRVRRLAVAVDVGRVVNPDGVRNQIEGGAVQATSWTLRERVRFDRVRVTSTDWESYPILRFGEVPVVDVEVLSRPDEPSVGAGEAAQGPTAAAIANAVARVLSVRVRDLPITAERIVSALEA
jgi:CO/xanthine dehydrogenase Mo-binding subunit